MKKVLKCVKLSFVTLLLISMVLTSFNDICVADSKANVVSSPILKAVESLNIDNNEKLVLNEYGAEVKDNEILLFVRCMDANIIKSNLSELDLRLVDTFIDDGIIVAQKRDDSTWQWINDKASEIDNIVAMMPNYQRVKLSDLNRKSIVSNTINLESTLAINDPLYSSQWYLSKESGINVQEAWKTTMGSPTIKVAVIDSGAAVESKEFDGRIIKQYDNTNGDNDASDDSAFSHGSHVSGIIAANVNNNFGISGIAPYVSLVEIDCFEYVESEDDEVASDASIFKAFEICIEQGVRIANMSFGAFSNELGFMERIVYITKLEDLSNAGVIPVSAAGNENSVNECIPADLPTVVGVVALDENKILANYSNYGITKDICAPGNGIVSVANSKYFQKSDGTSMAAPMVSGVLALMASRAPYVSNDELLEIIYTTATDLGTEGKDTMYANGLINAGAAMNELNKRYPVELVSYNEDNLVLENENLKNFTIKLFDSVMLSIDVTNLLTGEVVRTIYDVNEYDKGEYSISWDGKDANGVGVGNGKYCMRINVFSKDNLENQSNKLKHTIQFSFYVTDKDFSSELPTVNIKPHNNICYLNGIDRLKFDVKPAKDALCDVAIVDSNNDIISFVEQDIIINSKEGKTFSWNLYNKYDELVYQGIYSIAVIVKNDYANKMYKFSFSTVNVRKPRITKIKKRIGKRKSNKNIQIKFRLNTQSNVFVRFFNKKKKKVMDSAEVTCNGGKCSANVQLKKKGKMLKKGLYYFRIVASNNKAIARSKYIKFKIKSNSKKNNKASK